MARRYRPTGKRILDRIVGGLLAHADETHVNLQKGKGYVWALANLEDVVYMYRPGREADSRHRPMIPAVESCSPMPPLLGDLGRQAAISPLRPAWADARPRPRAPPAALAFLAGHQGCTADVPFRPPQINVIWDLGFDT